MARTMPIYALRRGLSFAALAGLGLTLACSAQPIAAADQGTINFAREREFWSFHGPTAPTRPAVKAGHWPRQELDYFILSRLEAKRLSPSHEAEKATLIRRVTFDLTGLPPSPEELKAFMKDKRRDAYERLVERLLASPRFGERVASLWLPLARYAEDQAHQVGTDTKFFYPHAYKYRDWVITAFNRDLPYDQFVRLQIAADKLERTNDLAALGFLGLGPKYYNRGRLDVMADEWEDRVDTVTRTFLGLTVACARCHDHKFDPITREDYYGLAGVFASTKMVNKVPGGVAAREDNSEAPPKEKLDPAALHVVEDGTPQDLNVFIRGNVERKGNIAPRRFIRVLSDEHAVAFTNGSGRMELAEAIASPNNPLTARVMVNRLWGMLFGKPIVATPSNFGHSGQSPVNQELLDILAVRFMQQGWSVKALVREMALSSTYRQDSRNSPENAAIDSANESLWRMNRRRLTVEQWRDSMLLMTGELDYSGGPSLELDDPTNFRRTVHARVSRLQLNSTLMQFDYPDANVHAGKRATTTTAMQKLIELNSPFVIGRAKALAARITTNDDDDETRVRRIYGVVFARQPDRAEIKLALEFLHKPAVAELSRWVQYAQMLLASNEMMYVD